MARSRRGNNPTGRNQGRGRANNPSGRNQHNQTQLCDECQSYYPISGGHSIQQCNNNIAAQRMRPSSPLRPGDMPSED